SDGDPHGPRSGGCLSRGCGAGDRGDRASPGGGQAGDRRIWRGEQGAGSGGGAALTSPAGAIRRACLRCGRHLPDRAVPRRRAAAAAGPGGRRMIAYLRGPILRRTDEVVVVEAGGIGYEVHLPAVVARALPRPADGEPQAVELHISYHATQNQPKPLLIGFLHEVEQEFFERFITVDGMGPTKGMK